MTNCPSAVKGAGTSLKEAADGVILDIIADDPAAIADIIARAHLNGSRGEPSTSGPPHTGQHTGPGTLGHCPIVHVGTTITVEEIHGGVRVTVIAKDPAAGPALQKETRARLAYLDTSEITR